MKKILSILLALILLTGAALPAPQASAARQKPTASTYDAGSGEDDDSPAEPGEDDDSPAEPGEDDNSPAEPGEDDNSPAEPGEDDDSSAEPGEDDDSPAEPGEDDDSPAEPGEDDDSPAEPGEDDDSPAEPGEDDDSIPQLTREHVAYIKGSGDLVRPFDSLSRAEAASIFYSLLAEAYSAEEPGRFTDVAEGKWYQPQVDALAELGILSGYADGSFQPGGSITRAEFISILARFFPAEEGQVDFSDVAPGGWAYSAISTGVALGWVQGYSDGTFRPGAKITRAEAVTMINRALGRAADQELLEAHGKALVFLDLPMTSWAYYPIMEAALPHTPETAAGESEVWESYSLPAASHGPGLHLIDGELYKVDADTGLWMRSHTDGVLTFGDDGRYTTGIAQLDTMLTTIVKANTSEDAEPLANLRRLYDYEIKNFGYRGGSLVEMGSKDWEADTALEMLTAGKGNCYRYTGLFVMLARKLGFQAKGVSGRVNFNTGWSWGPHGWAEVDYQGEILLCDPDVEYSYPHMDMFMRRFNDVQPSYRLA